MAKVSRETAAAHRAAIVAAAGRLFRARGIERVGVADVTHEVGLTHGGFYGHFASKEALAAEAIAVAFTEIGERIAASDPADWIEAYLSSAHRDAPETGCPMPPLATDAMRGGPAIARGFAEGFATLVGALAGRLGGGASAARENAAREILALLVGGQTLARTLAEVDRPASDALLKTLRERALVHLASAKTAAEADARRLDRPVVGALVDFYD